jgi:two-component system CheB/CheR fusion protein
MINTLDILLVENHPDTAKYMRMYLENIGHRVYAAKGVREALERLNDTLPHVLISDIGLPDGTGWELMERAQLPASVYTIAMSGFGTATDRNRSTAAGFRYHLTKPFEPGELERCLEEAAREQHP